MRPDNYGFSWKPETAINPALISAVNHTTSRGRVNDRLEFPHWVLDYGISSLGSYCIGNRTRGTWREHPPRVANLYPPQTRFTEDLTAVRGRIRDAYIIFRCGAAVNIERFINRPHRHARFLDPDGQLEPLLVKSAWIGYSEGRKGYWQAQALFCQILDMLVKSVHVDAETFLIRMPSQHRTPSSLVNAVNQRLRQDPKATFRLSELARSLHVSLSGLCHRYRDETGLSPMQARMRLRIQLARNFLVQGHKLETIAEKTGFCDACHLSRSFKRVTGVSPREFLRSVRADSR